MIAAADIVVEARSWIDTPFHHAAEKKGVGVDCVHLARAVYAKFNLLPEDFAMPDYTLNPNGQRLVEFLYRMFESVDERALRPADLVLIQPDDYPRHVGIVAERDGRRTIIHASNARSIIPARVVETRLMFSRALKFVAGFRAAGVSHV
jgi:cell wall-associated NlpC family hydrolase